MRLILDTHTILWYAINDPQLTPAAKAAIANPQNEVFISPANHWELAIKMSLGKLTLSSPFQDFWRKAINDGGYSVLPIELAHTERLISLPAIHRDPFDRLLIAQALSEDLTLVSCEALFDQYLVHRLW